MPPHQRRERHTAAPAHFHQQRHRLLSVGLQPTTIVLAVASAALCLILCLQWGPLLLVGSGQGIIGGGSMHSQRMDSALRQQCDNTLVVNGTLFSTTTLDTVGESVVLMLFSEPAASGVLGSPQSADTIRCQQGCSLAEMSERRFRYVSRAYVSSPFPHGSTPYYEFFAAHQASFWTMEKSATSAGRPPVVKPLKIDVVYTYVNGESPSHESAVHARTAGNEATIAALHRFRDWEELRHSLRSLRWHALRGTLRRYGNDENRASDKDVKALREMGFDVAAPDDSATSDRVLFRHVYVVVANRDQTPVWLDESAFPQLRIITHAELFTADEASVALPTLNSLSVESVLHRIPGLSRYFWYFNNDMVLGRTLSPFDLFRPLAAPRQLLYFSELAVLEVEAASPHQRHALLMEPILHVHGLLEQNDVVDTRPASIASATNAGATTQCASTEAARCAQVQEDRRVASRCVMAGYIPTPSDCAHSSRPTVLRTKPFMTSPRPPKDPHDYLNNHARLVVMERLEGVLPSFGYAHVPLLVDKRIFRFAMDDPSLESFAADAAAARRAYLRELHSFSPVHVYTPLALALRRDWDRRLWLRHRSTVYPQGEQTSRRSHYCADRGDRLGKPGEAVPIEALCPLCSNSFSIQQQHPHLFRYLSSWPADIGDSWHPRGRSRTPIEDAALGVFPASFSGVVKNGSGAGDAAIALYADVFHHTVDNTMRFIMAQDRIRLSIALALVRRFQLAGTPTLFTTINDDIEDEPGSVNLRWYQSTMTKLLAAASSYSPRAPWEKTASYSA